jgi:hypothetical protein
MGGGLVLNSVLGLLLIGFLLSMYLMDTMQVLLRAVATTLEAPVLGAHLGSVFMLANRAATALALLILGYFVDSFVPRQHLQAIYAAAAAAIALFHLPLLRRTPLIGLTVTASRLLYRRTFDDELVGAVREASAQRLGYRFSPAVAAVSAIGLIGLLSPSLLATTFPAYRATLMQTGFIINSIASIISVMYVERQIAITLDGGDQHEIGLLYNSFLVSRALGYAATALFFLMSMFALPPS